MGFSGLSADARKIHKEMMNEALEHRYTHGMENGVNPLRLAKDIASENHWKTMTGSGRPVGVGILILGKNFFEEFQKKLLVWKKKVFCLHGETS